MRATHAHQSKDRNLDVESPSGSRSDSGVISQNRTQAGLTAFELELSWLAAWGVAGIYRNPISSSGKTFEKHVQS